jgi:hypothetical protein
VINRRTLLVALAGGILATPLAVDAQQAGKVYRVGVLSSGSVALDDTDHARETGEGAPREGDEVAE